jgi:hypothetical protein
MQPQMNADKGWVKEDQPGSVRNRISWDEDERGFTRIKAIDVP